MPPIYYLNPPPNPFWDFVAGLEDHPFFAGAQRGPQRQHGTPPPPPPPRRSGPQTTGTTGPEEERLTPPGAQPSEKAQGKQPSVEDDPPEVDPSTIKPAGIDAEASNDREIPFRGRGRFAHAFENGEGPPARGRGGHCRGRGRAGHDPPPFMMAHPFFARPPWAQHDDVEQGHPPGPPHHGPEHGPFHGPPRHFGAGGPPGFPPHREHRGPPGPPPGFEHRGPPPGGPHSHRHGPPHARGPCGPGSRRRHSPHHVGKPGFDLSEFLNRLGNKLGVDLSNAAEGFGLTADRFTAGRTSQDVDFEPRGDIFENKDQYTIHLSLPGAKKSDIGVDYDGENSTLRITGVVHRPDVDEQMLSELVVDGRKRETGVFEKAIRLGTKRDPANIDVAGISAKMTDGVLVVKIPKIEKVHERRDVAISSDAVVEDGADYEDEYSEKPVLFDADVQARSAHADETEIRKQEQIDLIDMRESEIQTSPANEKSQETEIEPASKAHKDTELEKLPAYEAEAEADHNEEDWEKFSDVSGEGEYIKINVD